MVKGAKIFLQVCLEKSFEVFYFVYDPIKLRGLVRPKKSCYDFVCIEKIPTGEGGRRGIFKKNKDIKK